LDSPENNSKSGEILTPVTQIATEPKVIQELKIEDLNEIPLVAASENEVDQNLEEIE
jgi:hypothetical protein